jgi:hypothetical protein
LAPWDFQPQVQVAVLGAPDGCLHGLVDEVAQCLGELVSSVTHCCRFGSSVR